MAAANDRIGSMFGKYKLKRLLGQGGMGEVYDAYDTSKDRTVALKILRQELSHDERFRTRFQRESRAAAMLEAPGSIRGRHARAHRLVFIAPGFLPRSVELPAV